MASQIYSTMLGMLIIWTTFIQIQAVKLEEDSNDQEYVKCARDTSVTVFYAGFHNKRNPRPHCQDSHIYSDITRCRCIGTPNNPDLYLVDCSSMFESGTRGYVPGNVPVNATHFSLANCHIRNFKAQSFVSLSELIYLDISFNGIISLQHGAFEGLNKLKVLLMRGNGIAALDSVAPDIFVPMSQSLEYLDLSTEMFLNSSLIQITKYNNSYLANLKVLKTIEISYVGPETFGVGFSGMNQLENIIIRGSFVSKLRVEDNAFRNLQQDKIRCVNMTHSGLSFIAEVFGSMSNLVTLDLCDNPDALSHTCYEFIPDLKTTKLSFLNVKNTGAYILWDGPRTLRSVILDENPFFQLNPKFVPFKSFLSRHTQYATIRHLLIMLLSGSNIENIDLRYNHADYVGRNPPPLDVLQTVTNCTYDLVTNCLIKIPLRLKSLSLAHNAATSIGLNYLGPFTIASNSSLTYLDMSHTETRNLSFPIKCNPGVVVPIETLNLEGNDMECIHPQYFNACQWVNLKNLFLAHNNLGQPVPTCHQPSSFAMKFVESISTLETLGLSNNRMTKFKVDFSGLNNLKKVNLSFNYIPCLDATLTTQLDKLNRKRMTNNDSAIQVILNANELQCSCECLDFFKWLDKTSVNVTFNTYDHCIFGDDTPTHILQNNTFEIVAKMKKMCRLKNFKFQAKPFEVTILWNVVVTLFAIVFRFRHTCKYLWLKMLMNRQTVNKLLQPRRNYHAFVSCERQDAIWVKNQLLRNLETEETGFRFCVAQRDFIVGRTIIDNIVQSITRSERVVLIVSQNFLKSGWCKEELFISHQESLERGENMMICIFMPDVDPNQLEDRLRWITRHVTCIKWPLDGPSRKVFWIQLWRAISDEQHRLHNIV